MAHSVKVVIKSITGRVLDEKEYGFDKNLDKIVATIDTAQVIKQGGDIGFVMRQVADMLQLVVSQNLPLIIVPDSIKLEFIHLKPIEEENENVETENRGTSN